MLQKNLNVSDVFCGSFSLFFVLHFFVISSICMRSQHSQTQLPNHHTTIIQSHHYQTIIPKSHKNHTILETYVYICRRKMSIKNQYSHVFRFIPFSFFHLLGTTSFSLAVFTTLSLSFSLSLFRTCAPSSPSYTLSPSYLTPSYLTPSYLTPSSPSYTLFMLLQTPLSYIFLKRSQSLIISCT